MVSALTESRLKKTKPNILLRPKIPFNINIFTGFLLRIKSSLLAKKSLNNHSPNKISYQTSNTLAFLIFIWIDRYLYGIKINNK